MKKAIVSDANLVARCGLYCGSCGAYLNDNALAVLRTKKQAGAK